MSLLRRRRQAAPQDPGLVGTATGHARRIRVGGVLLWAAVAQRALGFALLFSDPSRPTIIGPLLLVCSAATFWACGAVSLSRPGQRLSWARGPARWGLAGLTVAEAIGVGVAAAFLQVAAGFPSPQEAVDLQSLMELLLKSMLPHSAALVVAALGLRGHLRATLRRGATLRRAVSFVLTLVVGALALWSLGSSMFWMQDWATFTGPTPQPSLAIFGLALLLSMMALPPLALLVGGAMVAQRSLSTDRARAVVGTALTQGPLSGAACTVLGDGAHWTALLGDRACAVRLDVARLPLAVEIRVDLPLSLRALRLTQRSGPGGVASGDPLLDRLVSATGLPDEQLLALMNGLHGEILAVVQGRPGSGVRDGAVVLRASVGPGLVLLPGSADSQAARLDELVREGVDDAMALAAALAERAPAIARDDAASRALRRPRADREAGRS